MQAALIDTRMCFDLCRETPKGDIEIRFVEYSGDEDTGRVYAGMITERALFDLLHRARIIQLQTLELGTGALNVPEVKRRG